MILFLVALIINIVDLINYGAKCYIQGTILRECFAGKTGCEKTYFMQKLAAIIFFGKIVKAE